MEGKDMEAKSKRGGGEQEHIYLDTTSSFDVAIQISERLDSQTERAPYQILSSDKQSQVTTKLFQKRVKMGP